jgi:hypothetical protein
VAAFQCDDGATLVPTVCTDEVHIDAGCSQLALPFSPATDDTGVIDAEYSHFQR